MVARETSVSQALAEADIPADALAVSRLESYTALLLEKAIPMGFLGPHEGDRLVPRHLVESAALCPFLTPGERVVDVGSGAGLPGLVLACMGWRTDLIETHEKRAAFLERTIADLGVDAHVWTMRAEEAGRSELRESVGHAVSRALAAPPVALELCVPFVRVGGSVLISTTREAASATDLASVAEILGASEPEWHEMSVPGADPPRCVMIVKKFRPTPERFPRRTGVPKRRPLG